MDSINFKHGTRRRGDVTVEYGNGKIDSGNSQNFYVKINIIFIKQANCEDNMIFYISFFI